MKKVAQYIIKLSVQIFVCLCIALAIAAIVVSTLETFSVLLKSSVLLRCI